MIYKTIITLILIVISIFLSAGIFFYFRIGKRNDKSVTDNIKKSKERLSHNKEILTDIITGEKSLTGLALKDIYVCSFDNLKLHGYYFDQKSNTTVIFVHGYKSTSFYDFGSISNFFIDKKFNLLFIDQRSHGLSEGKNYGFAYFERTDILSWCNHPMINKHQIILFGCSMGAASVLLSGCMNPESKQIKFAISDSSFNSMYDTIKESLKKAHFPSFIILPIGNLICKIFNHGCGLKNIKVEEEIKKIKIPILFIHGKKDKTVSYLNSVNLYELCPTYKDIVLIDNADHCMGIHVNRSSIINKIENFLSVFIN